MEAPQVFSRLKLATIILALISGPYFLGIVSSPIFASPSLSASNDTSYFARIAVFKDSNADEDTLDPHSFHGKHLSNASWCGHHYLNDTMKALSYMSAITILRNVVVDVANRSATFAPCDALPAWAKDWNKLLIGVDHLELESSNEFDVSTCSCLYEEPVILYNRPSPLNHIGHRMLTDWPHLVALDKLFKAVDVPNHLQIPIVLLDGQGAPAYGIENFKPFLESTGFTNFVTNLTSGTCCFRTGIVLSTDYWQKQIDEYPITGRTFIWEAPKKLMAEDPLFVEMVEKVKLQVGLPPTLGYAPLQPQTLVLASRDPKLRKDAKQATYRLLLNEEELFDALQKAFPEVEMLRVEFSTLTALDTLGLMQQTSVLLGYHGAALDFTPFLPRGAYLIELLPNGTRHPALYPAKAATTGKLFARYMNTNMDLQSWSDGIKPTDYHNHNLKVNITEVISVVETVLRAQRLHLQRLDSDYEHTTLPQENSKKRLRKRRNLFNTYF